jgi:hypothetical protein
VLFLVEDSGFEPMTFPLTKRDAMADSTPPPNIPKDVFNGGGERVRTDDLLRARQALSQLSYTPEKRPKKWWAWMDLNHRPHAYQACALTELSYRPSHNPSSLSAFLVN